jgi:hypothetical protein
MNFDFKKYSVLKKINLDGEKKLVLFSSCIDDNQDHLEILGNEIFLFDIDDNLIWQVSSPQGERHFFNDITKKYETEPYGWYFSSMYKKEDKILAEKFNGDVFEIDMETGKAEYVYWTK